jgi:hypothetical protein
MSNPIAITSKSRIARRSGAFAAAVVAGFALAGCAVAYPEPAYYGPGTYAPGYSAPYPSYSFRYYYYGSPHRSYQPYGGYRHYR